MSEGKTEASIYQQAEDGKTELSLMHFAITNPQWQPPQETTHFISQLKERVHREATGAPSDTHPLSLSESEVKWQASILERHSVQTHTLHHIQPPPPLCLSSFLQPRSLIANILVGPSTLASIHFGRDGSLTNHTAAVLGDGASALRSLSPVSNSLNMRSSFSVAHRSACHTSAMSKAMAGSGWEHWALWCLSYIF